MRVPAVLLVILLSASGCASYALIEPTRTRIGESYSVDPQIKWTSLREGGRTELWTVDGPALESLQFMKDVGDGQSLLGRAIFVDERQVPEEKQPRFRATMTPSDIVELVVDTWSLFGASKIRTTGLRPAKFGNADGFRFELAFVWADGVEGEATAVGVVIKQRLQLIVYSGTRLYYFGKYRLIVDRLVESIHID